MALWMVRIGKHGEHEQRFLQTNRIYVTWTHLNHDLRKLKSKEDLRHLLRHTHPHFAPKKVINHSGQIWPFIAEMKPGDWVIIPSKQKSALHIAEITGDYTYEPDAPEPYYHWRTVKWVATDIPRSNFDQDLLNSFGAIMAICQIERHDAEKRVRAMQKNAWKSTLAKEIKAAATDAIEHDAEVQEEQADLEELGRDAISQLISRRFQNHDLTRLVEAVLKAQGYATYRSPPGPDKGIDILAAPEPLGFGLPRICVQVKSGDTPVDTPTLNQLIGAMQNVHADQGLLVSWSGFKSSVDKEIPAQFFRVRLWDQKAFIDELLTHYDRLDPDLRAELPLKRIWTVAVEESEE
jgi:restriction system protein